MNLSKSGSLRPLRFVQRRLFSSTRTNTKVVLRSRPSTTLSSSNFEYVEEDYSNVSAKDGQVVVKNKYISMDPTHRIWASAERQYMPHVELGDTMRAITIGEVVESKADGLEPGDYVYGLGMVQNYYTQKGKYVRKVHEDVPLTTNLSVCGGIIGLTAYVGAIDIINPKPTDTIVISGAAGAVGSIAGQLAKQLSGCRVVGICGSEEKKKWLTDVAGFDGAVSYKSESMSEELYSLAPGGVDGYFDNTGGPSTEVVLNEMNNYGRVAVCGVISAYNHESGGWGPSNYAMILHRRLTVQGFVSGDPGPEDRPWSSADQVLPKLTGMVRKNKLVYKEDVRHGLENYVETINLLFTGENNGKLILEI